MSRSHVTHGMLPSVDPYNSAKPPRRSDSNERFTLNRNYKRLFRWGFQGCVPGQMLRFPSYELRLTQLAALDTGHSISVLALSGGGEHGAFGAGLLNGWSESGRRPSFDIVLGVSTGA